MEYLKITDEFGNYMTFTYINNSTTTGDFLISEINYTGNATANQLPYNKVVFEYEDYTNFVPYYFDGVQYSKTKRLKRVKTYEITYSTNTSNTLFSVSEIKEQNYLGEELNSTKFNWDLSDNTELTFQNGAININGLCSSNFNGNSANPIYAVGDINGDGFNDIVVIGKITSNQSQSGLYHYLNNGDGTFGARQYDRTISDMISNLFLLDVDRDGKDELLFVVNTDLYMCRYSNIFNNAQIILSGGYFFFTSKGWNQDNTNNSDAYVTQNRSNISFFADINGDGILDFINSSIATINYAFGNGDGTFSSYNYKADNISWLNKGHRRMMADVNGDGKADLVGFHDSNVYVYLANGNGFDDPVVWTTGFTRNNGWINDAHDIQLVDINGDGMADIAGFGASQLYVYLSTGTSFKGEDGTTQYSGNGFPASVWNLRIIQDIL